MDFFCQQLKKHSPGVWLCQSKQVIKVAILYFYYNFPRGQPLSATDLKKAFSKVTFILLFGAGFLFSFQQTRPHSSVRHDSFLLSREKTPSPAHINRLQYCYSPSTLLPFYSLVICRFFHLILSWTVNGSGQHCSFLNTNVVLSTKDPDLGLRTPLSQYQKE